MTHAADAAVSGLLPSLNLDDAFWLDKPSPAQIQHHIQQQQQQQQQPQPPHQRVSLHLASDNSHGSGDPHAAAPVAAAAAGSGGIDSLQEPHDPVGHGASVESNELNAEVCTRCAVVCDAIPLLLVKRAHTRTRAGDQQSSLTSEDVLQHPPPRGARRSSSAAGRKVTPQRKQNNRKAQQRYREKRKMQAANLEQQVVSLTAELQVLQVRCACHLFVSPEFLGSWRRVLSLPLYPGKARLLRWVVVAFGCGRSGLLKSTSII